jgi:hypothetical protein
MYLNDVTPLRSDPSTRQDQELAVSTTSLITVVFMI